MRYIFAFLAGISLSGCVASEGKLRNEQWVYYERWDENGNIALDPEEFRTGYVSSGFFKRWEKNGNAVPLMTFCDSVFQSVDIVRDSRLDSVELSSKRAYYLIGDSTTIKAIRSASLSKTQFHEDICRVSMAARFDKSTDQHITTEEMAAAMFDICDSDKNGSISPLEFYLWEIYRM